MAEENYLKKVEEEVKKHPWYLAGALGAGGLVFYYVMKRRASAAAAAASSANSTGMTPADQAALQNGYNMADMAGMPYGYISDNGPTDNYPSPQPPVPPPPTSQGQEEGMIRPRFSSSQTQNYDQSHPQGVPVDSQPGGANIGYAAFSSEVQISGPPVSGPSNFGSGQSGSTIWWPVTFNGQPGYISGYDILSVFTLPSSPNNGTGNTGSGGGGYFESGWQLGLNSHRNTVDQFADGLGNTHVFADAMQ